MMDKLMQLWLAILNKLHLYTFGQHNRVCEMAANMYEIQIRGLTNANDAQTSAITTLESQKAELEKKLADITAKYEAASSALEPMTAELESLRDQILAYNDAAMENVSYVKDVQKQLSKVLHESEAFGFPNSMGIPGSTSIRTFDVTQDGKPAVLIQGRTIVLDELTKQINETPDMGTRLRLIMGFMEKYGTFTKIARDLFSYGAVRCVLGYSEKCTNYELYYEIVASQANMDSLLVVRNPDRVEPDEEQKAE